MYIILVNCHLLFEFPEKLTQEAGFACHLVAMKENNVYDTDTLEMEK